MKQMNRKSLLLSTIFAMAMAGVLAITLIPITTRAGQNQQTSEDGLVQATSMDFQDSVSGQNVTILESVTNKEHLASSHPELTRFYITPIFHVEELPTSLTPIIIDGKAVYSFRVRFFHPGLFTRAYELI